MEDLRNWAFERLKNHFGVDQNLNILKRKLEELNAIQVDTESRKNTELQPRKKLKKAVEIWFQKVDRVNGKIRDLENKVGETNWASLSRGSLGAKVLKRTEEVEELIGKGESFNDLTIDDPQWIGQVLSETTLFGELPKKVLAEIWEYLMDDAVSKIGVWGMGGVGKTTIMKLINNQLLKETEKFDIVIWVTVSKETNIARLQDGIACALKKESHCLSQENDETRRAGMLYDMLTQAGKYVLILDDVWDKFSLEEVGIPKPSNGSKMLITTRSLDVCQYFGAQEVKLHALPKQDAWNLFLEKVGEDILHHPDLLPIVKSVAEECDGLPLAIVTIASSMKGVRTIHGWSNALNVLRRCGKSVSASNEKIFQQLQFSYDRLGYKNVKNCFLYLALYPEDCAVPKDKLVEKWIDEGFVEEMDSMQEETFEGHVIMDKLINNCLFETSVIWMVSCVKLHDLMRDMALRITSATPRFLVKAGMQLKQIPGVQEWTQDLEKVSFQDNWELGIPLNMSPPKCGMLTTLLLGGCGIESIPKSFFDHMLGLKVLDLSYNCIVSLPTSVAHLKDLTVLLLHDCEHLKEVPSLSNLQALKKLNLARTGIEDLPHGMERLVNLQHLDLSCTLVNIPDGLLAKLTSLRSLKVLLDHDDTKIFVKGEEIGGLNKLEQFEGVLSDLDDYVQAFCARTSTPSKYEICVGSHKKNTAPKVGCRIEIDGCRIPSDGQAIKILSNVEGLSIWDWGAYLLNEEEPFFSSSFIPMPHPNFSNLSHIELWRCGKIKKLFSLNWMKQNLQNLVGLGVSGCDELEEIIASDSESDHVEEGGTDTTINFTLPKLKTLKLRDLPRLKSICSANRVMVCDSIIFIQIVGCPELKRMPLYRLLGDDGQPSRPRIIDIPSEMEWDHSNAARL